MRGYFQQTPDDIIKELIEYLGKIDPLYFRKVSTSKNRIMRKEVEKTLLIAFELIEQFL